MISIIIPAYNAQSTMSRVIDSILKQTYLDWELLIVNDGSTDNTEIICQSYVENDKRIRLYNQKNQGVSAARNLGIKNSLGQFIVFIDADDEILNCYLQELLSDNAEYNHPDIIIQGHIKEGKNKKRTKLSYNSTYYNLSEKKVFFEEYNILTNGFSWAKLFIRDIIIENNVVFDDQLTFCEDLVFLMKYLSFCNSVYISNKANYTYNYSYNSLSTRFNNFNAECTSYTLIADNYVKLLNKNSFDTNRIMQLLGKNYKSAIIRPLVSIVLVEKENLYYKKRLIQSLDDRYFIILKNFFRNQKIYKLLSPFCNRTSWFILILVFYCRYVLWRK